MKKIKNSGTNDLERLRQRKIAAEHDYLVCLRSIYAPRFDSETTGYLFDEQHLCFELLFGKGDRGGEKQSNIDLYRKLIAITHPDKCGEPWAKSMSQMINDAADRGDMTSLCEMDAFYEKHKTFEGYVCGKEGVVIEDSLEKQNERLMSSLWYVWYFDNACGAQKMLKKCFIHPDVHELRYAEYKKA